MGREESTDNMTKHLPREGDLPIEELVKRAAEKIHRDAKDGVSTDVHFKFTCEHCGERCMFEEPNQIYATGECHKCGKETKILVGGYTTVSRLGVPDGRA